MTQATQVAIPCAACKQPVIEKRTLDGALVVLDAGTKRVHLCVKRKAEAPKAQRDNARRDKPARPAPRPPVKRPVAAAAAVRTDAPPASRAEQQRKGRDDRRGQRLAKPVKQRPPRKRTLRSPEQVQEILKGKITRWRTGDGPTSFCDNCGAPVLVGFSHVRWDVIMVDAAGHRPHDCEVSRAARAQPAPRVDVPELNVVAPSSGAIRTLAPVTPAAPIETASARPRRVAAGTQRVAANTCETCGNLKASVNGEWVCLHCG